MANFKITNPEVKGKLKLFAETASRALQVNSSGELESSTVTTTELGYLSGVTSAIQTQLGAKAESSTLTAHTGASSGVHGVTGSVVGTSDTQILTNKTIDADSNTITNIENADIKVGAAIDALKIANGSVSNTEFQYLDGVTSAIQTQIDGKISSTEKGANNGVATLDGGGKIPVAQLPNAVMTYEGVWDASTNTPTLADGTGNAGMVYRVSVAGSVDFGSGAISFSVGDYVIYSGTVWEKSDGTDAVNSVNGQTGIVVLTKSDVGLGNVDNTSDATKNAAVATLTNKTIDADDNTILDLTVANLKAGVLDTDLSSVSGADDTIPSAKAVKAYADSLVGAAAVVGDIPHTVFSAANNVSSAANVTGLAFASASIRSFKIQISVSIDATTDLNEVFELTGVQLAGGFVMASTSVGDDSGVVFTITSAGQVQYTSQNSSGFVSSKFAFRAYVTLV
jgi:hypothetical protein